jgi:DNA-binding transcriptional regulator YhcF (GntR family)
MSSTPLPKHDLVQRLRAQIRQDLKEGLLQPGESLQPIRTLAGEYGVSYVTMQRALKKLEASGVVHLRQGSGVFAADPGAGGFHPKQGRTGRTRILAVLPSWSAEQNFAVTQRMTNGLLAALSDETWAVEFIPGAVSASRPLQFLDYLLKREPDGVAWMRPGPMHLVHLARLADRAVPLCVCGRRFTGASFPSYSYDLAAFAQEVRRWCKAENADEAVLIAGEDHADHVDPYSLQVVEAFQEAGCGTWPGRVIRAPRASQRPMVPYAAEFLKACKGAEVLICAYGDHFRALSVLAEQGFWGDGSYPALIDLNQHHVFEDMPGLAPFRMLRAEYAFEEEGRAMGEFFQTLRGGETPPPEDYCRAALTEVRPASHAGSRLERPRSLG